MMTDPIPFRPPPEQACKFWRWAQLRDQEGQV